MILQVRVTPNARKDELLGWQKDPLMGRVLRVKVAAEPVEGKANKALLAFIAKSIGVAKSMVTLEKGDGSRVKRLRIPDGVDLERLELKELE